MDYTTAWNRLVPKSEHAKTLKFIDLFAGIGGFHIALSRLGANCVMTSEIDKQARVTYEANHSIERFVGDITQVHERDVPDHDILCGGFPCQPFSQAGKKHGFDDIRGTLFFDIARILAEKRPAAVLLENVRNLVKHGDGQTFARILSVLDDLGYDVVHKIVKASDYGLPQHRPRVFIVAFDRTRGGLGDFIFPQPMNLAYTMSDIFGSPCDKTIGMTLRVGGRRSGLGNRHNWDSYLVDGRERIITVQEGLMMLGFPSEFQMPRSQTAAFRQIGNSVAVPTVYAIAKAMVTRMHGMA
jgi:DNA (cytosine-5)-methyltransferase 1